MSTPTGTIEITEATRLLLYQSMLRCRGLEKKAYDLFMEGLVQGTTHLGLGQEAVAAGFAAVLRPDDMSFGTYRGHNHMLLRGMSMASILGECAARAIGCCGGKGGSMHITDVTKGAMGSYAIVGAHLPVAVGAAWAGAVRGTGQVSLCFFGDGTTNIGTFHEAVNLAAVWKLPVVFVCENNLYMEYTAISAVIPVKHPAADRASAYGLEPIIVDGNDPDAVYEIAVSTVERARRGEGPSLVEALTYRHKGHSRADPGKYRPDEEVAAWMARDPLPLYRARLESLGFPATVLDEMERLVKVEVEEAADAVRIAPLPNPATLLTDLWANGGSEWRN